MKRIIFCTAIAAMALTSCSSDDFLGENPGTTPSAVTAKEISFSGTTGKISRADKEKSDAAEALDNNFIVFGTKIKDSKTTTIYNYYNVNWKNSEGTNEGAWVYVGETKSSLNDLEGNQSLKYWDYSATSYDFVAFSLAGKKIGESDDDITITKITDSSNPTYTLTGKVSNLQSCYIADRITRTSDYNSPVKFTFHSTGTKVSVGFYETIPGYSIKSIKFYENSTSTEPSNTPVLYANSEQILENTAKGTLTVSFDNNNKANAVLTEGTPSTTTKSSTIKFSTFNLDANKEDHETKEDADKYLSRLNTSPTSSSTEGVLPCKITGGLNMKVDYTLIATDGSGEEIEVKGATVNVPETYTDWKNNFHYTYKFKISENTNGNTGEPTGPAGLYPIVFEAVVKENQSNSQTTETEFNKENENTTKDITNEGN